MNFILQCIYLRSPAAYHAVRSMGIFQLPCDKTLRGYMYKHASLLGISEEHLLEVAKRFREFKSQRVSDAMAPPVCVLIFDEITIYVIR